jgi:serine protease AprX
VASLVRHLALWVATLLTLGLVAPVHAAGPRVKIWVVLADKGPQVPQFSASTLSNLAFENAPLHEPYLGALTQAGFQRDISLKWQNRVSGFISVDRIEALRKLPGVKNVEIMPRRRRVPLPETGFKAGQEPFKSLGRPKAAAAHADSSFDILQATYDGIGAQPLRDSLAARGLNPGAGIRIAILDADFDLGNDIFKPLLTGGRIRDQFDFVANRPQAVTQGFADSHGAQVLSVIGGDAPGLLQGAAPAAEFLLYRTEDAPTEGFVEEDYLAAAMERAVDSGALVVNISLGYRYEFDDEDDVPYAAMDGKTRPSSIAVAKAAQRNVLVTVSVGNLPGFASLDGTPTLQAPADADGILAVGIADNQGIPCSYSCSGPTFDGRIKPDIMGLGPNSCAVPVVDPQKSTGTTFQSGTSFSAPAMAGVAALLRQAFPQATALEVREALVRTAVLAGAPTNASGYGLARADWAWRYLSGDTMIWAGRKPRSYGPKSLLYPGRDVPWPLTWVPGAKAPTSIRDVLGRRFEVGATPFGAVLEVKPKKRIGHGVYILP